MIESNNYSIKFNRKFIDEIAALKAELEVKDKKIEDEDRKNNEIKSEIKVLQSANQKYQIQVSDLELDLTRVRKESIVLKKESNTIKEKPNLKNNIFNVILKKSDNIYLKQAKEENKLYSIYFNIF